MFTEDNHFSEKFGLPCQYFVGFADFIGSTDLNPLVAKHLVYTRGLIKDLGWGDDRTTHIIIFDNFYKEEKAEEFLIDFTRRYIWESSEDRGDRLLQRPLTKRSSMHDFSTMGIMPKDSVRARRCLFRRKVEQRLGIEKRMENRWMDEELIRIKDLHENGYSKLVYAKGACKVELGRAARMEVPFSPTESWSAIVKRYREADWVFPSAQTREASIPHPEVGGFCREINFLDKDGRVVAKGAITRLMEFCGGEEFDKLNDRCFCQEIECFDMEVLWQNLVRVCEELS